MFSFFFSGLDLMDNYTCSTNFGSLVSDGNAFEYTVSVFQAETSSLKSFGLPNSL